MNKILIVGAGNMGSWLAEELCLDYEVAVFDLNPKQLKYLMRSQRFTNTQEIKDFEPQLAINAVSLQHTYEAFEMILPALPSHCILSDITSVKNDLPAYYKRLGRPFVSTHPMFGPTFANIKDLTGHNAIIIKEGDEAGQNFFRKFYKTLNLNIYEYTFREHDKIIAYSLSIPFATSLIFGSCIKKIDAPGTTFKKHMAIAQGLMSENAYLLSEVLLNSFTLEQLGKIKNKLSNLVDLIEKRDTEGLHRFFDEVRKNIENK